MILSPESITKIAHLWKNFVLTKYQCNFIQIAPYTHPLVYNRAFDNTPVRLYQISLLFSVFVDIFLGRYAPQLPSFVCRIPYVDPSHQHEHRVGAGHQKHGVLEQWQLNGVLPYHVSLTRNTEKGYAVSPCRISFDPEDQYTGENTHVHHLLHRKQCPEWHYWDHCLERGSHGLRYHVS